MKFIQKGVVMLTVLFLVFLAASCKEEWNEHYSTLPADRSELNLYEFIKSQPNLSTFTKMLEVSGYDSILSKPQTFTVWAPTNDALTGLNPADPALALEVAKNHVTRFSYTSSGISKKIMLMLNNKLIPFERLVDGFYFNRMKITQPDLAVSNGILHIINEYAPYKKNIWEFINSEPGLDSLRNYINSLTKLEFDPLASYKDEVLIDSIFKLSNPILEQIAKLNVEDSTYTAILPNNNAWTQAYNKIYPYYNTLPADGGVAQQRQSTMWSIVRDLFFRDKVLMPVAENPLISTTRTRFYNADYLFEGLTPNIMSNGLSYVQNTWTTPDTVSWFKSIRIEAESSFGRTVSNYSTNINSGIGTGMPISNGYYLVLRDAALSILARLYSSFSIPNTMSARYNVYAVFVPRSILDPNDMKPFQVKFYLTYVNANGALVTNAAVSADHKVLRPNDPAATFTTDPTKVDKMLVIKDFQFPYSNTVYTATTQADLLKQIKASLRVETVNTREKDDLFIDCIILEPVL